MNEVASNTAQTTANTDKDVTTQAQLTPVKIVRCDMVFNPQTYRYEAKKSRARDPKHPKKKKAIITVKRFIGAKGQHEKTIAEMHHEPLVDIFHEINAEAENIFSEGSGTNLDARVLFCSHTELKDRLKRLEEAKEPGDQEKIEGLQAVIQLIEEDFQTNLSMVNTLNSKQETMYDFLWTLFRPKTQFTYRTPYPPEEPYAKIECEIIAHDNMTFGRVHITREIPQFKGTRPIVDLPLFPFKYHKDYDILKKIAVERGKLYTSMRLQFCQYKGAASVDGLKRTINERIMVDPESSFEYGICDDYVHQRLSPEDLSDDDYLICTPMLLGFCLTTKAWGRFAIDRISAVPWLDEPFDKLVLGAKQKGLISALVKQHTSESIAIDDIVPGKGKGLVGLLCGGPGCGKTLTAEAVAEMTHRPLYAVSMGELGTTPSTADKELRRILQLGERWNAVVLLDEADVFLQERDRTDVTRNALVSIFLRQVEYHPGILIFTTNLIGNIDSAFESRIHFCVKYHDLDFVSRKTIWRTYLSKADSVGSIFSERNIASLARKPLNGRQIKNAVSTAKSIAASESSPLALKHIQTVLEVMQDWQVAKFEHTTYLYRLLFPVIAVFIVYAVVTYLRSPSTPLSPSPSFLTL